MFYWLVGLCVCVCVCVCVFAVRARLSAFYFTPFTLFILSGRQKYITELQFLQYYIFDVDQKECNKICLSHSFLGTSTVTRLEAQAQAPVKVSEGNVLLLFLSIICYIMSCLCGNHILDCAGTSELVSVAQFQLMMMLLLFFLSFFALSLLNAKQIAKY